jgi:DNA invertase Pin-like site-specific DNA recombinase
VRCAIYTRKSSEEGLEQSFNSLDAQREACEAYVTSQIGEGWTALPSRYDDGGYSGGSMERPGLQRLLADIVLRKVDVVVVYKVDRLTRSLADFARIVDTFDANGVSFVSVTQAFNTTTSMGRLTLNVLLSFAQFEREVTGERIRDKIAASKKKGMWMGGTPPLGYRPHERTLTIDEDEAETVRHIFSRYLEIGSVHELKRELDRDGIWSRPCRKKGMPAPFSRGALYHLLSNRIYIGEIVHKGESYAGQHEPIIEQKLFDSVQQQLATNGAKRRVQTIAAGRAPLAGLIFDAQGRRLSPVSSRKPNGRVYRYYVSADLQRGCRGNVDRVTRVTAVSIEELVLDRVERACRVRGWPAARACLNRVEIDHQKVTIILREASGASPKQLDPVDSFVISHTGETQIEITCAQRQWRGGSKVIRPTSWRSNPRPRVDPSLVRALTRAHALVRIADARPGTTIEAIAAVEGTTPAYVRRLIRFAYLAPDIQQAIIDGRLPMNISLEKLMRGPIPNAWSRQRELIGF